MTFSDFRSHGPISLIGDHPVHVLPVSPLPLAGRISQRTRSRTAATQRLHRDDQHDGEQRFRVPVSSLNSRPVRESSVSSRAEPAPADTPATFADNPETFNSSAVTPPGLHSACAGSVTPPQMLALLRKYMLHGHLTPLIPLRLGPVLL